ncbi:hypothetical protein BOX15_Mlig001044g1 [Macrostomum lignano]|uniref:Stress-associated endoplasmic reticulum protein n=1 Tax=Macrostomum lignano TaxID=282301 RepID=A0A267DJW1_9PLAT|nr:hypothetical protein BOX15_Mlig001044g2 [Macrostomum lignano]PAA87094.1 hypothetical protein BOX15_Mlig001044g1 [Macrostomum lignano]
MAPKQRMRIMNERASNNITQRGNIPKSLKTKSDGPPVSAWLLGVFVFVVCGSAIFEIVQHIRIGI